MIQVHESFRSFAAYVASSHTIDSSSILSQEAEVDEFITYLISAASGRQVLAEEVRLSSGGLVCVTLTIVNPNGVADRSYSVTSTSAEELAALYATLSPTT